MKRLGRAVNNDLQGIIWERWALFLRGPTAILPVQESETILNIIY
jgi:hypothetical protein